MHRLLPRYDLQVLFTRRFPPGHAGGAAVAALAARFPEQVLLGNDLLIPDYYRALWIAELQVSTATHESLGMSTLEAMHTGTCCILPRLGSYPEITGQHPDVLYDLGESQLAERLTYFLEHPDRRRELGAELMFGLDPWRGYRARAIPAQVSRTTRSTHWYSCPRRALSGGTKGSGAVPDGHQQ